MERSTLFICFLIAVTHCIWTEGTNLVTDGVKEVGKTVQKLFANTCIEDLGCFYTGPPFFHTIYRPMSLSPTNKLQVKFYLFTPSNPNKSYDQEVTVGSMKNSPFDRSLDTKILLHGFMTKLEKDDVRYKMKDAFLRIGRFNVFVVDWTKHNGMPYEQAVANTRVIGAMVAKLVHLLMNETNVTSQSVHIIGHSLGAHTAGYAGKRISNLGRITGLDPAGPYFHACDGKVRLDRTDALFVDIIHTDGAETILTGLGISEPIGHIDFYPNGGSRQPGCSYTSKQDSVAGAAVNFTTKWINNGCDHSRSSDLFLESIDDSKCRFLAVHCSSYSNYERGQCTPNNSTVAEMGYHVNRTSLQPPARFYLKTNGEKPYCHEDSIRLH